MFVLQIYVSRMLSFYSYIPFLMYKHFFGSNGAGNLSIVNIKAPKSTCILIISITSINYEILHLLNINVEVHRCVSIEDPAMEPIAKENESINVFELHILKYVTSFPNYTTVFRS